MYGKLIVFLLGLLFLVQYSISDKKSKVLGLIIPSICLIFSIVLVFRFNDQVGLYGRLVKLDDTVLIVLRSIGIFTAFNLPTVGLISLYYSNRDDNEMEIKERHKN